MVARVRPVDLLQARELIRLKASKRATRTAQRMAPPDAAGLAYFREVQKLNRLWQSNLLGELTPLLVQLEAETKAAEGMRLDILPTQLSEALQVIRDTVDTFLEENGVEGILAGHIQRVDSFNFRELGKSLGIDLRDSTLGLGTLIDSFRLDNVLLIKSLLLNQLQEVSDLLDDTEGYRVEEISSRIQERFGVSRSRAAVLARDQTSKLNARITQQRQQSVGVTKYRWTTSRDEKVRDDHEDLDKQVFEWINPPITNKRTKARNHPGEDIQCRCTATPILDGIL